mmetsp:Transcript_10606/g.26749  ORF Transcript_10606/g.26749 Transcript_10606/m.26749 type:complete len:258 (-) Transcript_10606:966-1739(-)
MLLGECGDGGLISLTTHIEDHVLVLSERESLHALLLRVETLSFFGDCLVLILSALLEGLSLSHQSIELIPHQGEGTLHLLIQFANTVRSTRQQILKPMADRGDILGDECTCNIEGTQLEIVNGTKVQLPNIVSVLLFVTAPHVEHTALIRDGTGVIEANRWLDSVVLSGNALPAERGTVEDKHRVEVLETGTATKDNEFVAKQIHGVTIERWGWVTGRERGGPAHVRKVEKVHVVLALAIVAGKHEKTVLVTGRLVC